MRFSSRLTRLRSPMMLGLGLFLAAPAATRQAAPEVRTLIEQMSMEARAEVSVSIGRYGTVSFLSLPRGSAIPMEASLAAEDRGRAFLARFGRAFALGGGSEAKLVKAGGPDLVGMEHLRYRQTWHGVPVTGGEIAVHLNRNGVVAVNAKTVPGLDDVSIIPTLGPEVARQIVYSALVQERDTTAIELGEPRLEILNRGLLGHGSFSSDLVWFVEARGVGLREYIWVDAHYGKVAFRFSQLNDARTRRVHDTGGSGNLPGPLVRSEGQPATGNTDVDFAYDFSGDTYDYFRIRHGRDSYDGQGAILRSTVDYCQGGVCPFENAFWNGQQMVYGPGYASADDVVGHELTHAVTEYTANLFYYMQSGALNESYSDVFGETIDLTNGAGTDNAGARWELGEDLPVGAIRDMRNPTLFGDPGKVSDPQFFCGDDYRSDGGGVHFNSGVNNHAYTLAVDGGTYNGVTVGAVGIVKAGKIWYRALTRYLLSASDFLDNYNAINQSCTDLIGAVGITAANCNQVRKALNAVEMNDPWPCTPTQAAVPRLCPAAGQAPLISTFVNFESTSLPACPANNVPSNWCSNGPSSLLGSFATSGIRSAWGYNKGEVASQILNISTSGTLSPNSFVQFNHSFGFENSGSTHWDGGVVEYSTNGGASWTDLGPSIVGGAQYNGTIDSSFGNPLGGRNAFGGDSWGYTATRASLSGAAGSNVRLRFHLGTDSLFDEYGWFIDDIRIFRCFQCVATRNLNVAYNGTSNLYKATNSIAAGNGFKVGMAENVRLEAGNRVILRNGFSVDGGKLVISIQSCP